MACAIVWWLAHWLSTKRLHVHILVRAEDIFWDYFYLLICTTCQTQVWVTQLSCAETRKMKSVVRQTSVFLVIIMRKRSVNLYGPGNCYRTVLIAAFCYSSLLMLMMWTRGCWIPFDLCQVRISDMMRPVPSLWSRNTRYGEAFFFNPLRDCRDTCSGQTQVLRQTPKQFLAPSRIIFVHVYNTKFLLEIKSAVTVWNLKFNCFYQYSFD